MDHCRSWFLQVLFRKVPCCFRTAEKLFNEYSFLKEVQKRSPSRRSISTSQWLFIFFTSSVSFCSSERLTFSRKRMVLFERLVRPRVSIPSTSWTCSSPQASHERTCASSGGRVPSLSYERSEFFGTSCSQNSAKDWGRVLRLRVTFCMSGVCEEVSLYHVFIMLYPDVCRAIDTTRPSQHQSNSHT